MLENRPEENLSEEERKAAWDDYEKEKQGLINYNPQPKPYVAQQMMPNLVPPVGGSGKCFLLTAYMVDVHSGIVKRKINIKKLPVVGLNLFYSDANKIH